MQKHLIKGYLIYSNIHYIPGIIYNSEKSETEIPVISALINYLQKLHFYIIVISYLQKLHFYIIVINYLQKLHFYIIVIKRQVLK